MARPLASAQEYISTSLPQTVLTSTQNALPVFLKDVLLGKVFPIDYLFKATLEHCCDVIIIHFGLHPNHIQAQNFSPPMAKPLGSPLLPRYELEEWYWCISCGVCRKRTMNLFFQYHLP